ncbi:T9SS type A sorting domain-containing protein, partial [bacterium]|nr:T9SS type A sorting domain-containing protein [bacterium]
IKNFGRKAADTFLVIATIEGGSGVVYADTLTWSLTADTEDTVSFKEFKPTDAANYTITVSTLMTPDESDEDDEMSKTLYGSGIVEPVTPTSPSAIQLEITSLSSVRYTLPSGERGTLTVYDPSGRRIESYRIQGEGQVAMKSSLSSGVYFVKLEAGKTSVTRKAVVLR